MFPWHPGDLAPWFLDTRRNRSNETCKPWLQGIKSGSAGRPSLQGGAFIKAVEASRDHHRHRRPGTKLAPSPGRVDDLGTQEPWRLMNLDEAAPSDVHPWPADTPRHQPALDSRFQGEWENWTTRLPSGRPPNFTCRPRPQCPIDAMAPRRRRRHGTLGPTSPNRQGSNLARRP